MTDPIQTTSAVPALAAGRSCEGCTACCKLPAQAELKKPPQVWCDHCEIGKGCKIYDTRPADCRTFYCGWVLDGSIGEEWNPRTSRMIIKFESNRTTIFVDQHRRDAWRKEPYNAQVRRWAAIALARGGDIIVWEGLDGLSVLPNAERGIGRAPPV